MLTGNHASNFNYIMTRVVGMPGSMVSTFEPEAYGACLTLVYLRAMPLIVRNDLHMTFMARGGLWAGRSGPTWTAAETQARHAFYAKLISIKRDTFEPASFDALTNADNPTPYLAEPLVTNPWSLSDSEFSDGMVLLRHGVMPDLNGEGLDDDGPGKQAGKAVQSVIKDEYLDFITDFLKESARGIAPMLRGTVRFAARASLISAVVETLADLISKRRVDMVKAAFEEDEPRRVFLQSVGWGQYVKPMPLKPPHLPSYMPKVAAGSR